MVFEYVMARGGHVIIVVLQECPISCDCVALIMHLRQIYLSRKRQYNEKKTLQYRTRSYLRKSRERRIETPPPPPHQKKRRKEERGKTQNAKKSMESSLTIGSRSGSAFTVTHAHFASPLRTRRFQRSFRHGTVSVHSWIGGDPGAQVTQTRCFRMLRHILGGRGLIRGLTVPVQADLVESGEGGRIFGNAVDR